MDSTYAERPESISLPWCLVLLEGIVAVTIGLFLLTSPGITLLFLVQVTRFFWLIGGILRIVGIFMDSCSWSWKLVGGILSVLAGIVVFQHSVWSTLLVAAIYVIILGVKDIMSGGASLVLWH